MRAAFHSSFGVCTGLGTAIRWDWASVAESLLGSAPSEFRLRLSFGVAAVRAVVAVGHAAVAALISFFPPRATFVART